jgi:FlaG/FlaF family flagellin (archaellin)
LWKNSKGVSGIIAAVFLVLVVLFLYANVFTFILTQNTSFQGVVSEVNQMDIDRSSEIITVSNVNYTVAGNQVYVEAQVTNDGPVSVQIITLWVIDTTTQKYGYNDTLNINLKTGDTLNFTGPNALRVTIGDSSSSSVFTSWFVTDRGNLIPLEKELIVAQLARGIGYLTLEFDKFRYFTYESEQKLANYPDGTVGFDVPKNEYVAFGCYLTNLDPKRRTIVIDSHSLFWQPGRPGVAEGAWFIVNVNDDGTINGTYSPISVEYKETEMLVFASQNDLGLGSFKRLSTPNVVTTVATFILLHGDIGSDAYAQNIPFVSLFYS